TTRTGSDRDGTMLAAAGPDWSAEVTRLTIQVPVNAVTSHTGVPGSCATATADSAVTSATCDATSQRMSVRAPATLVCPVARASCPSAQSHAYASCQPTSAARPTGQAATVPP